METDEKFPSLCMRCTNSESALGIEGVRSVIPQRYQFNRYRSPTISIPRLSAVPSKVKRNMMLRPLIKQFLDPTSDQEGVLFLPPRWCWSLGRSGEGVHPERREGRKSRPPITGRPGALLKPAFTYIWLPGDHSTLLGSLNSEVVPYITHPDTEQILETNTYLCVSLCVPVPIRRWQMYPRKFLPASGRHRLIESVGSN